MKKIYLMLVVTLMTAILPVSAASKHPQVFVKSDGAEIRMNLSAIDLKQMDNKLLPGITECKEATTTDITVKAEADAEVALRMEADSASVLNNYAIVIKDANNNVIYDGSLSEAGDDDTYVDMPLGTIAKDTESAYTVTYKLIDDGMNMSSVKVGAIARTTGEAVSTNVPEKTLAPKFEIEGTNTDKKEEKPGISFGTEPTSTSAPGKTETDSQPKEITKICGKDIPAGRYTVVGNGHLKVTSANGQVKSSFKVAENLPNVQESSVILLEKDDVITITPLDGEEKAKLKFVEITPADANKSDTDKANTGAATNKANTPTPKNPTVNTKTNPKTGDSGMGIIIGVGIFAILAVGGLEFLKYRKKKAE